MQIPPPVEILELWVNAKSDQGMPPSEIAGELRKRLKWSWGQAIDDGRMSQLITERREQAGELIRQLETQGEPVAEVA